MELPATDRSSRISHIGKYGAVWVDTGAEGHLSARLRDVDPAEERELEKLVGVEKPVWGLLSVARLADGTVEVTAASREVIPLSAHLEDPAHLPLTELFIGVEPTPSIRDISVPPSAQLLLDSRGELWVAALPWLQHPGGGVHLTRLSDDLEDYLEMRFFGTSAGNRDPSEPPNGSWPPEQTFRPNGPSRDTTENEVPAHLRIPALDESLPVTAEIPQIRVSSPRWGQLFFVALVSLIIVGSWFGWRWNSYQPASASCPNVDEAGELLNALLNARAQGLTMGDPQRLADAETGPILESDQKLLLELSRSGTQLSGIEFNVVGLADLRCSENGWQANAIIDQAPFTSCSSDGCTREQPETLRLHVEVTGSGRSERLLEASPVDQVPVE